MECADEDDCRKTAKGEMFVRQVRRQYNKPKLDGRALEKVDAKEKAYQHEADNDFSEAHIVGEYIFFNELNICK